MLLSWGFTRCNNDRSIFVFQSDGILHIIALYVDDLLMLSNNLQALEKLKYRLGSVFEMTDLGSVHYILGIKITRDRIAKTFSLSQSKYIDEIVARFNLNDSKSVSTPMDPLLKLTKELEASTDEEKRYMSTVPYRQAVGSLMYVMVATRPDIATAVGQCSRYLENPGKAHWSTAKRIITYLRCTKELELVLNCTNSMELLAYADSELGRTEDKGRSTTGYLFTYGGGPISWKSQRQNQTVDNTMAAEYIACAESVKELLYLQNLLSELGFAQAIPWILYNDNQSCIALAKDPVMSKGAKFLNLKYHLVREQVEDMKQLKLVYLETGNMPADIFTKPLSRLRFLKLRNMIGLK